MLFPALYVASFKLTLCQNISYGYQDTCSPRPAARCTPVVTSKVLSTLSSGRRRTSGSPIQSSEWSLVAGASPPTVGHHPPAQATSPSTTASSRRALVHRCHRVSCTLAWTEYARVCFQECSLSDIINGAGWSVWSSSTANIQDVTFQEYDNSGSGASGTRASFATKISTPLSISSILGNDYSSWVDMSYL